MRLRWTAPAEEDLVEILEFISADDPGAAVATMDRIEQGALRIREFPLTGRAGSVTGTRELPLPGLPFLLIYQAAGEEVIILRVLHEARRWP